MRHSRKLFKVAALGSAVLLGTAAVHQSWKYMSSSLRQEQLFALPMMIQAEEPVKNIPQTGVVTGNYPQMAIITIKFKEEALKKQTGQLLKAIANVPQIVQDVTGDEKRDEEDEFSLPPVMASVGVSTRFWKQLNQSDSSLFQLPEGYSADYETKTGEFGSMPFQETELVLHVKAKNASKCYEAINLFVDSLPKGSVETVNEHYGFQYQDSRDLSKFIDGINNPSGFDDRTQAALNSKGGSFMLHQKWAHHHNLDSIYTVRQQEEFVGRERPFGAELSKLPPHSHVARMRKPNNDIIPIVRQSFPYGTVTGEHGLLFIAYSSNTEKYEELLNAMVGKANGTHNDAIMKFSKCLYTNYYYVPSVDELQQLKKKY